MQTTTRTTDRALRLSAIATRAALIGLSLVAACDTDQTTAPAASKAPPVANAAKAPTKANGSVIWNVVDETQLTINGGQFKITGPLGATVLITDNGANDGDQALGHMAATNLVPGQYTLCQVSSTPHFLPSSSCSSIGVYANSTTGGGTFVNVHRPHVKFGVADDVMNLIGGASFTLTDSLNYGTTIVDNGPLDADATLGKLLVTIPHAGTFQLCESAPPNGFVIPANQGCVKVKAQNGVMTTLGNFANYRPFSASWAVTDGWIINGWYNLLAGAKFRVNMPGRAGWFDVLDNDAMDYDKRDGFIAVSLPTAGTYTICEQQTPSANYKMANPACVQVTVAAGVPKWMGYFINPLQQVFNP